MQTSQIDEQALKPSALEHKLNREGLQWECVYVRPLDRYVDAEPPCVSLCGPSVSMTNVFRIVKPPPAEYGVHVCGARRSNAVLYLLGSVRERRPGGRPAGLQSAAPQPPPTPATAPPACSPTSAGLSKLGETQTTKTCARVETVVCACASLCSCPRPS